MKDGEPFISRLATFLYNQFRDVWFLWLVLGFVTTIPYVLAALRTPPGCAFSGVLTAYDDTFAYFAWMRQGADAHLLMCDPFTSETQPCEFFLPLWAVLGFVSRVFRVPIPIAFHIARVFGGLLLLVVARAVAGCVMRSRIRLKYTLWLYGLSGGLGWLVYVLKHGGDLLGGAPGSGSADLDLPEAIAFRSIFSQVHFAIGAALACGAIKLFFTAIVEKRTNRALIAGMLASLLAVVHPYMVVVVCGVSGVALAALPWVSGARREASAQARSAQAGCLRTQRAAQAGCLRTLVAFGVGAFPGIAYLIYLNQSNVVLHEWLKITDTFSPPPWEYALGFGLVSALAVVGFGLLWKRHVPYGRLLLIWTVVQAALLYAPVSYQRRFVEGLQLPLSVAASVALFSIARKRLKDGADRHRAFFMTGALVFASLTNVGFVVGQIAVRGAGTAGADPRRYVPVDLLSALDWIRANSAAGSVLFSSYLTGNIAPSVTGRGVFLGHYAQTRHSAEKGPLVSAFFNNTMSEEAARRLFNEHRVRYVIYGQYERAISSAFDPPGWLRLVSRYGDVLVFEVSQESDGEPH